MTTTSTASTAAPRVPARTFQTRPGDHRFFSIYSIVTSITVLAGFASTYGPKVINGTPTLPWIIHLHAAVFTCWLAFYVTQTTLVARGRTAVHRRLGIAGVVLAGLMFVVGTATAIAVTRSGHRGIPGVEFPDAGGFLLLNLAAVGAFSLLIVAGWWYRRNAQAHKRLMVMAVASGLVGPGVSRLPFASGNPPVIAMLVFAFLLAGPVYDGVTRRRIHPAYLWSFPVAILALPPIITVIASTDVWHRIASMLIG